MPFKKGVVCEIGDAFLMSFSMEKHRPLTLLSMDSTASSAQDECPVIFSLPPDINLPLSSHRTSPPHQWSLENCNILEVGLVSQPYETENLLSVVPKVIGRKYTKRVDSIWGAWFFFSFYFKPVLNEKSKAKIVHDRNGVSGFQKSDLKLDVFMVQHDMENMYMWVFKEMPENSLGKMQLRSYMNGHSREGERLFPFSVEKGFVRSHKMQRKHYRGLSNPQCLHGIEVVPCPNLKALSEDDRRRWRELTGRDLNFTIPPEAGDYISWRNLPNTEFDLEKLHSQSKKLPDVLNLSSKPKRNLPEETHPSEPNWLNEFSGVLRSVYGPVTATKTIYEDEKGYLIMISLPFVDLQTVKVSWRNTLTHGIIKVSCVSTSRVPIITRNNRTFKMTDSSSDHCPPGEFIREIRLSSRIPEDGKIEAYYDGPGTVLEVLVPKPNEVSEEHEVRVSVRPRHVVDDLMLS